MKIGRVTIFAFLDLEQNSSFLDGHYLVACITYSRINEEMGYGLFPQCFFRSLSPASGLRENHHLFFARITPTGLLPTLGIPINEIFGLFVKVFTTIGEGDYMRISSSSRLILG